MEDAQHTENESYNKSSMSVVELNNYVRFSHSLSYNLVITCDTAIHYRDCYFPSA